MVQFRRRAKTTASLQNPQYVRDVFSPQVVKRRRYKRLNRLVLVVWAVKKWRFSTRTGASRHNLGPASYASSPPPSSTAFRRHRRVPGRSRGGNSWHWALGIGRWLWAWPAKVQSPEPKVARYFMSAEISYAATVFSFICGAIRMSPCAYRKVWSARPGLNVRITCDSPVGDTWISLPAM